MNSCPFRPRGSRRVTDALGVPARSRPHAPSLKSLRPSSITSVARIAGHLPPGKKLHVPDVVDDIFYVVIGILDVVDDILNVVSHIPNAVIDI